MKEHSFDTDIIMAPRRSEKRAWIVASVSAGVSVLMALSVVTMMPLKTTEVFTVLVDRDTGEAERIMQVQPTGIDDEQAMKESLVVSYVSDREAFLMAGSEIRESHREGDTRVQDPYCIRCQAQVTGAAVDLLRFGYSFESQPEPAPASAQ